MIELYGLRLSELEKEYVEALLNKTPFAFKCSVHKLQNDTVELYTYKAGANNHSYDQFHKFSSKGHFIGYCKAFYDLAEMPNLFSI